MVVSVIVTDPQGLFSCGMNDLHIVTRTGTRRPVDALFLTDGLTVWESLLHQLDDGESVVHGPGSLPPGTA